MRLYLQIPLILILMTISACSSTQLRYSNTHNDNDINAILNKEKVIPEYVEITNTTDSAIVIPEVKHYYTFKYNDLIGLQITPEGILLYFYNQGVIVLEAWYSPDRNQGKLYIPPRFIAVLKDDSSDLWRTYFELSDDFIPKKSASSKWRHFFFTGVTKAAPNQALKPTE